MLESKSCGLRRSAALLHHELEMVLSYGLWTVTPEVRISIVRRG